MFDKNAFFQHHLNESSTLREKSYDGFAMDYEGKQWGWDSTNNIYEQLETGEQLNFAQFQNRNIESLSTGGYDNGQSRTRIPVNVSIMAEAQITISGNGTIPVDKTLTLIDSRGVSQTYTAKNAESTADAEFDRSLGSATQTATSLKNCIRVKQPDIAVIQAAGVLTLVQKVGGEFGNTTITTNIVDGTSNGEAIIPASFDYGAGRESRFPAATRLGGDNSGVYEG